MPILYRDYETRSTLDLKDAGAWRYSTRASTDVWCCAYAVDDGEIKVWEAEPQLEQIPFEFTHNPRA